MALFIEIKAADGLVSRTRLEAGKNRFTVRLGDSYQIIDDQTGLTPAGIAVKRIDNNLIVDGLDAAAGAPAETTVEFFEFYSVCSAGSPCQLTVDNGSGSAPIAITPGTQPIGALADGSFVLYDPNFADSAPPAPSMEDGTVLRNVLYGVGGLAVVGLAAGGGGGGGDDGGGGRPDGALKLTSSQFTNSRTPTFTGEGEPGSRVTVRIDTNGDGTPDVTYATTVGADFLWSVNLGTAVAESGSLPPGGLPDASSVSVTSTAGGVNTSLPTFVLAFDGVAPPAPVIAAVATDNVVNAAEKQNGFAVSGTAEPGSTVVLSLNGQVLASVPVSASGQWQTEAISGASLPGNGDYVLSAVAQDPAGNLSAAAQSKVTINTAPPAFSGLQTAGGDNVVSIADAAAVNFSGRTDPGATVQVQWNGGSQSTTAAGNGNWTLDFTGVAVPNSPGGDFPYSITATNAIGNTIVQPGQIRVDRQAPGAPVIAPVEGDSTVTLVERADGVPVTGSGEAGAQVQVRWGSTTRTATVGGDSQWAVTFAPGELPAVPSPGGPTTLTATLTDAVGNSSAAQSIVNVDQPFPAPTINDVAGNNLVNGSEALAGVALSGSLQSGAAGIIVSWGGFSAPGVIAGGTWTVNVPSGSVPADGDTLVTAALTGVGGGAAATRPVTVDRAPPAAPGVGLVEGDDVIDVVERVGGVVIQGTTELGTTVSVALGSAAKFAVVSGSTWSVAFTEAELPNGPILSTIPTAMSASAYDAAGNASSATVRTISVQGATLGPSLPAAMADEPTSPIVMSEVLAAGATGIVGLQDPSTIYSDSAATLNSLLREEVQSSGLLA